MQPLGLIPTKICRDCEEEKSTEDFYKHKETKDRLRPTCKKCVNKSTSNYYLNNKENMVEKRKAYHFKKKYNLSMDELERMKEDQNYCCKICKELSDNLVVDHDHKTGTVRGLLCSNCNLAVGYIRDNPWWPAKAIAYLEKYGVKNIDPR